MMKWRVTKDCHYEPEEYFKTLEVLDNVLAEFDEWSQETEDMDFNSIASDSDAFCEADCIHRNSTDFPKRSLPAIRLCDKNDKSHILSEKKSLSPHRPPHADDSRFSSRMHSTTEEQRIQQLRSKFQRVRELLQRNVVSFLDSDPPSFIPPSPPPTLHSSESYCDNWSPSSSGRRESPTVEDIPHLLPTDVLLRPQFGITYSLEEDLSPGIKEIYRTSTPKTILSSFCGELGRLSTFSNSQSELEVNSSSTPDRVPITSFKSSTLPRGLDRFPFHYPEENFHLRKPPSQKSADNVLLRGEDEKRKTKTSHFSFKKFSRKSKTGSVL